MSQLFAGRLHHILQAASKAPKLAPRFYSAAGEYLKKYIIFYFTCFWKQKGLYFCEDNICY